MEKNNSNNKRLSPYIYIFTGLIFWIVSTTVIFLLTSEGPGGLAAFFIAPVFGVVIAIILNVILIIAFHVLGIITVSKKQIWVLIVGIVLPIVCGLLFWGIIHVFFSALQEADIQQDNREYGSLAISIDDVGVDFNAANLPYRTDGNGNRFIDRIEFDWDIQVNIQNDSTSPVETEIRLVLSDSTNNLDISQTERVMVSPSTSNIELAVEVFGERFYCSQLYNPEQLIIELEGGRNFSEEYRYNLNSTQKNRFQSLIENIRSTYEEGISDGALRTPRC